MENHDNFVYNPETNYDEATMQQQKAIESEIAENQSLVGDKQSLDCLASELSNDPVFYEKVKNLGKAYKYLRRTRGDGNCFYRAFGFAYMEYLLKDPTEHKRFTELAQKSKDDLVALGYQQFTIEDFHSIFMETLSSAEGEGASVDGLLSSFTDNCVSDYIVVYLRLLVSGHLQREQDFFACFIEGDRSVKEFCSQEVEPMGKESDHIHITALTAVTGVPVRVVYLDRTGGGAGADPNHHDFPEGSQPLITLLYRPGHYDILYDV